MKDDDVDKEDFVGETLDTTESATKKKSWKDKFKKNPKATNLEDIASE